MTGQTQPDVLIIGAGAVGTMLACDLLQQDIGVRMVDRKDVLDDGDPHSRAVLIWPRMLELLRRIGVVEELVEIGFQISGIGYYSRGRRLGVVPMNELGTASPFTLALPQREIERVLRERHKELGGTVELGVTLEERELTKFGRDLASQTANSTPILVAGLCYLLVTIPLGFVVRRLETKAGEATK